MAWTFDGDGGTWAARADAANRATLPGEVVKSAPRCAVCGERAKWRVDADPSEGAAHYCDSCVPSHLALGAEQIGGQS